MSPTPKRILVDFLRHGEPEGGDILRGQIDPALTDLGWSQMRHATGLSSLQQATDATPDWTEIVSSPLQRCRHFAEHAAQTASLAPQVDLRWQEIDYGDWDGMPIVEWRQLAAAQFKAFRNDMAALAPPNGENFIDFKDRVLEAWDELASRPDGSHLLVVTHGGVLRVVLPTVLGMPLNRSFPLHIPFACFTRVAVTVSEGRAMANLLFHNLADLGRPTAD